MYFLLFLIIGCSKAKAPNLTDNAPIKKIREILSQGNYDEALKETKDIVRQIPLGSNAEEALFLQGYILAYDKSDFQAVRLPLKQLLDLYPKGFYAKDAQKLLADCYYWQGNYDNATKEYKKLLTKYSEKGFDTYVLMQIGNCLLLNDKVGDALNAYRELVEKYPADPLADSAQLMIANTYLKLQNLKQAKSEFQKLVSFTRNKDIQRASQRALRQIEEEEPFHKGVGVPE
jgi:TolA-binding protein